MSRFDGNHVVSVAGLILAAFAIAQFSQCAREEWRNDLEIDKAAIEKGLCRDGWNRWVPCAQLDKK